MQCEVDRVVPNIRRAPPRHGRSRDGGSVQHLQCDGALPGNRPRHRTHRRRGRPGGKHQDVRGHVVFGRHGPLGIHRSRRRTGSTRYAGEEDDAAARTTETRRTGAAASDDDGDDDE